MSKKELITTKKLLEKFPNTITAKSTTPAMNNRKDLVVDYDTVAISFNRENLTNLVMQLILHLRDEDSNTFFITTWRDNGFLSRVLPLTFSYSFETQQEIQKSIQDGDYKVSEVISKDAAKVIF